MATYVGIDQALRKIGVCILVGGEVDTLELIRPLAAARGPERLTFLRDQLQALLTPYKGQIRHASLEAQSLGSIGDIDQLGQVSGMVQIVLADAGVPKPFLVPPATLKKFVTGHPQASKERMMRHSERVWGIVFDQDDLCDAHGLARISEEFIEQRSTTRHQVEAIYSLTHPRKKRKRIKKQSVETL